MVIGATGAAAAASSRTAESATSPSTGAADIGEIVPVVSTSACAAAGAASGSPAFLGRGTLPGAGAGTRTGGGDDGASIGCSCGNVSGSLAGGLDCGSRSPLSRRLTVGYSTSSAGRAIGGASTAQTFTSSERGSKFTGCAAVGSGRSVPSGRAKLKVAA